MKRFKINRFLIPFFIYLFIAHILFFASPFAPSVEKTKTPTPTPSPLLVVEEALLPKPKHGPKPTSAPLTKLKKATPRQKPKAKKRTTFDTLSKRKPQAKRSLNLSLPTPIESLHSKSVKTLPKLQLQSLLPSYENKLTFFMQEALKLPKYGEVKVAITLHCSGKVIGVNVLEAHSDENKTYLLQTLPSLQFPPFLQESHEEIQTFTIRFFNS